MIEAPQMAIGKWFIGFLGNSKTLIVDHISPPGFRHCLAFAFHAESGVWLVYDVAHRQTLIYAIPPERFVVWLEARKEADGMRVLAVETRDDGPTLNGLGGLYCVSAVKHVIGSRSWALRPIGLWFDLLKVGAVEAFAGD